MHRRPRHGEEPQEPKRFTERFDRFYTRFAPLYDWLVKATPIWKHWLEHALPYIEGPRVLEASCGTGYLLTRYASRVKASAIDLNPKMVALTKRNLREAHLTADVRQANVEALPYPDATFDTVVNTMAFSGYPNGRAAMAEMSRVLKPGGRIVMIDVGYPADENRLGTLLTDLWRLAGDLIRDMDALFADAGFDHWKEPIGGYGSVQLYVATKS